MMPQFDIVLINSIFFVCFFYFVSFFFFLYNKLPVLTFFLKYLDKILYLSYVKIIHLEENYAFSFPSYLFYFLGVIKMSNIITISFFRNKRLIMLDLDFQYFF